MILLTLGDADKTIVKVKKLTAENIIMSDNHDF